MKTIEDIRDTLSENRENLEARYNIKSIGVFGSYARGTQRKRSDVDVLVEFRRTVDFFEFLRLEEYLKELLGVKVDLVSKGALKPYIGKSILEEVVYL
jgi:predicted nucleotidyltransferase